MHGYFVQERMERVEIEIINYKISQKILAKSGMVNKKFYRWWG